MRGDVKLHANYPRSQQAVSLKLHSTKLVRSIEVYIELMTSDTYRPAGWHYQSNSRCERHWDIRLRYFYVWVAYPVTVSQEPQPTHAPVFLIPLLVSQESISKWQACRIPHTFRLCNWQVGRVVCGKYNSDAVEMIHALWLWKNIVFSALWIWRRLKVPAHISSLGIRWSKI